jgi:ComEC/Rec2-related protein
MNFCEIFKNININKYIFFNFEYYRNKVFFLFFFIVGVYFYLNFLFLKENILLLNIYLLLFSICIIYFLNKIHEKYFIKIQRFDFFFLNTIYILYILLFFLFGVFGPNLYSNIIIKNYPKQINNEISIKEKKYFIINEVYKFDISKKYICFIAEEFKENNQEYLKNKTIFEDKNIKLKICSHFLKTKNIKNLNFIFNKNLLEIEDFKINPIEERISEYEFNLKRLYFLKKIIGSIYSNNIKIYELDNKINISIKSRINNIRYLKSLEFIDKFGENNAGLMSALVFGNRIFMQKDINENMRNSSMLHLVAISGLHISIISFICFKLVFLLLIVLFYNISGLSLYFILKKISLIISLCFTFIYLVFSGFSISSQRAFLMFFLYVIIQIFGKQQILSNIIFISIIIFGFFNPMEFLNPGFQMSFLAIIGIYTFSKNNISILYLLSKSNLSLWIQNVLNKIFNLVLMTFGPYFFTAPVSLFYFNQIPTYTFISNIIAVPLMTFIIAPLIVIYLIFHYSNLFFLEKIIFYLLNKSFFLLNYISNIFSNSMPLNILYTDQISKYSFFIIISSFLMIFIWKNKKKYYISFFIFIIGIFYIKFEKINPEIIFYKEKNYITYIFFDHKNYNIYYFFDEYGFQNNNHKENILHSNVSHNNLYKKHKKYKINFFLKKKFDQKYNFIYIDNFADFKNYIIQYNINLEQIYTELQDKNKILIYNKNNNEYKEN